MAQGEMIHKCYYCGAPTDGGIEYRNITNEPIPLNDDGLVLMPGEHFAICLCESHFAQIQAGRN